MNLHFPGSDRAAMPDSGPALENPALGQLTPINGQIRAVCKRLVFFMCSCCGHARFNRVPEDRVVNSNSSGPAQIPGQKNALPIDVN